MDINRRNCGPPQPSMSATHYAAGPWESAMAFSRRTYERSKLLLREFEVARMWTG